MNRVTDCVKNIYNIALTKMFRSNCNNNLDYIIKAKIQRTPKKAI